MKIAIVGANGLVGTRLTERYHLAQEHEVVALVRRPASMALPARFTVDTRIADALDTDAMARAMSGCSAVVHTAHGDPAQIERMPGALCLAAAAAGVRRVIYLSSASVHGPNPAGGTDESTPLNAQQPLESARARVRAEQRFFAECERHGLVGFALRPGVVYGPRSHWIADIASDLVEGRAWLYESGRNVCNAIYVDNVVQAVSACLHATDDVAGAYLIGDGETITWEQFYRSAALHVDVAWPTIQQVTRLPAFKHTWRDRAGRAVAHPFVQRLLPLVPPGLKRGAKAVINASGTSPRSETWSLPNGPRPRVTEEMALLQQCTWALSHQRARQQLDYHPVVTFAEGMERSFAWWRFAQGDLSQAA